MHFDGLIFFFRLYYWHLLPLLWLNLNEMWPEPLNKKNPKRKQAKGAKNGKTDKRKPRSLGHVNVITLKFMCICNMATCNMWSAWKLFFRVSIAGCLSAILLGERLSISCCLGNINLQLTHSQMPDPINWKMQDANYKLAAPKSTSSSATGHARRSRKTE